MLHQLATLAVAVIIIALLHVGRTTRKKRDLE
jgi:hypothetical protein